MTKDQHFLALQNMYRNNSQFIAEAVLYYSEGNQIGRGSGVFVRSKLPLSGTRGYAI